MKQTQIKGDGGRTSIDWDAVHRRMEAAIMALEQGGVSSTEEKRKILKVRAKVIAHEAEKRDAPRECLEIIEFLLAGERYGIEASYVREIYPLKELVPVPATPPFVLGITSVRGKILSVIDVRKLFDLLEKGLTELDKVIIVQAGKMELGIHADAVLGMRLIALDEMQSPLPTLTGIPEKYLRGITREQVTVLDMEKFLSDKSIAVHEEAEI